METDFESMSDEQVADLFVEEVRGWKKTDVFGRVQMIPMWFRDGALIHGVPAPQCSDFEFVMPDLAASGWACSQSPNGQCVVSVAGKEGRAPSIGRAARIALILAKRNSTA